MESIKVYQVMGISSLIVSLYILGLLIWKLIEYKESCWSNIINCLLQNSIYDIFGAFIGMIFVIYISSCISVIIIVPIRYCFRLYHKHDLNLENENV
jgi:hypothetical protein